MIYSSEKFSIIAETYNIAIATVHFKSVKTLLQVKNTVSELSKILKPYQEIKNDLIRKYGKGDVLDVSRLSADDQIEFSKQWNELEKLEVDFTFSIKIKLSDLKNAAKIPSAKELTILEDVIDIDIEE